MIDISFEINGRRVDPHRMQDALEGAVLQSVKEKITSKIRNIRDQKTGLPPKIRVKGTSIRNLSFDIEGSEEVIKLVKEKLK
ncbi:hypothetical protein [Candidatus Contendibacter odensensis]|uniref:Uncharacterized protein n=1 Tax=Candidatus Contendobacter odensis Run_B_J11 TaxID=1400861 RepID=A0A7U7J363_9GAMM|nr:hypothetical protein [Candidatus Contendobacter odensis]CDH44017.1 conserved hypothetical protein [Candidatus Contendobacter odensis Run_B_J11]